MSKTVRKSAPAPKKTPKKKLGTCKICFDDFKSDKTIVACPFCDSRVCKECSKDYLLSNTRSVAHCTSCKKEWPATFFTQTFSKSFRTGPYLENKKKILLDEQTAALPSTLPLLEAKRKEEILKKEVEELKIRLDEMRKKEHEVRTQIMANEQIIKNGVTVSSKKIYMMKCPKVISRDKKTDDTEMCRGFIEKDTHSCTLCKTKICDKCHVILFGSAHSGGFPSHECKKEDVESAKMILADTKPCPSCSTRIHKVVGCDQMFCTQCHTAFSWTTGNIETGTIHNPHYYELMRKLGNNRRTAGDVPCGGLADARFFLGFGISSEIENKILIAHRRCAEITTYIQNLNRENLGYEDIRMDYLMGKLTEEQFRENLYQKSCTIEKRREELQILSTFQTALIERLNKLPEDAREVYTRKILRADYEKEQKLLRGDDSESDDSSDDDRTAIDYNKLTVPKLKEILRKRNLPNGGLKADLINRLVDADNGIIRGPQPEKKVVRRRHRRGKVRPSAKKTTVAKATSVYMLLPIEERKKIIEELFENVSKEINKIVRFCNNAFIQNFKALGYEYFPIIDLNIEYKYSAYSGRVVKIDE